MKFKSILFLIFILFFLASKRSVFATRASLSCVPATGTYNVGDTIAVSYNLDTRGFQAFGADLVATYTTSILEAAGTGSTPIISKTNWSSAPTTNTVDASLGKIRLDWGKSQPSFTGSETIGQITFKAKAAGQGQFNYLFNQQYDDTTIDGGAAKVWGKKDGTNISNILTDVTNCIYVVSGAAPTSPPFSPAPTVTELPRAGVMGWTLSFLGIAVLLILSGALIPVFAGNKWK